MDLLPEIADWFTKPFARFLKIKVATSVMLLLATFVDQVLDIAIHQNHPVSSVRQRTCVPLSIAARSVAPLTHATRGCKPLLDGLPNVLYRTFSVRWTAVVHGSQGVRRTLQMETEAFEKTVVHREMTVD